MGGANQDERREHGLSRSFIVTTAAGRSNLIPRMAHATRAAALTVLLGRVVNLAPNAGKQSAFGSVIMLACSADCVSAVVRKFITPENALCVVLILTTS